MTNHPLSVLWHCWLGHQTCKNRRPYNLYCVGADVKPCSISIIRATTLGKLFTPNVPLFIKQYNLVPCEGLHAKSAVLLAAAYRVQWTRGYCRAVLRWSSNCIEPRYKSSALPFFTFLTTLHLQYVATVRSLTLPPNVRLKRCHLSVVACVS